LTDNITLTGNKGMGPILLKKLIEDGEDLDLVAFFARHSITCYELDKYLDEKRKGVRTGLFDHFSIDCADTDELIGNYKHWRTAYDTISPSLIKSFGGKQFIYNFRMYASRTSRGSTSCLVAPDDHYRPRFEQLVKGGVAKQGENIPKGALFEVLTMNDLRSLANKIGIKEKFSKKSDIIQRIAQQQEAEDIVKENVNINDIFFLPELNITSDQVEKSWSAISCYARTIRWAYLSEADGSY
jgi:hypothetical protein